MNNNVIYLTICNINTNTMSNILIKFSKKVDINNSLRFIMKIKLIHEILYRKNEKKKVNTKVMLNFSVCNIFYYDFDFL
jgi:hypothetical protein